MQFLPNKCPLLLFGLVLGVLSLLSVAKCDTNSSEFINFCDHTYVDSAYFNGYDVIVTRDDWLWYYYKDYHNLSAPFSQRAFTQGDHIQGAFNISKIPECDVKESTDCKEFLKMKNMAVYFLHNKARGRGYYNLDVRSRNGSQRRVKPKHLPWAMKQVGLLGGNLWPNGWEAYQEFRPVAYLPDRYEMVFIINGRNFSSTVLAWNSLDTKSWNSSWKYKDIGDQVVYTGMFELNGIIYAIGETKNSIERVGRVYRYHMKGRNDRKLTETNQMVTDFFGCPERSLKSLLTPVVNTVRTGRDIKTGSVLTNSNKPSSGSDDDSILISIFIGIVITACLTTIILSFVTITGRKKSRLESDIRIEPTIPKVPVVGLDYCPRQSSNVSGFDSMSSITAIYSQINKPLRSKTRPTINLKPSQLNHNPNHNQRDFLSTNNTFTNSNGVIANKNNASPPTLTSTVTANGRNGRVSSRATTRPGAAVAVPNVHSVSVHRMPNGTHAIQLDDSDNNSLEDNLAEYVLSNDRKSRK